MSKNTPAIIKPRSAFDLVRTGGLGSKSQVEKYEPKAPEKTTIAFLFDATGSRRDTWIAAQKVQGRMISEYTQKGRNVEVGIIVHRGGDVETLGWFEDGDLAKRTMEEVSCEAGGTQIERALMACLGPDQDKSPKAIVMVGDCCEEELDDIKRAAQEMKQRGIPVHSFHEGDDQNGERTYKTVTDITNGAFAKFGADMKLDDLVKPLFVHAVEGEAAFKRMVQEGHRGAQALSDGGLLALPPPPSPG